MGDWDVPVACNCLYVVYAVSVVLAWVGLYKVWRRVLQDTHMSGFYRGVNVIGFLLLLALVIVYTVFPVTWILTWFFNYVWYS